MKDSKGKWVAERLQMFGSFAAAMVMSIWAAVSNYFTETPVTPLIVEIIGLLLAASGLANFVDAYYKIKNKKIEAEIEDGPINPPNNFEP